MWWNHKNKRVSKEYEAYSGKVVDILIDSRRAGGSNNFSPRITAKIVGETDFKLLLEDIAAEGTSHDQPDYTSAVLNKDYIIGVFERSAEDLENKE